jgi:general secretion pathway protein G
MKARKILTIILVTAAILVCVVLPRFYRSKKVLKVNLALLKIEPVRAAIGEYILNTGKLPRSLEDLVYCPQGLEESWKGPYLKLSQLFDPWGNMYILEYGYRLQSLGADGIKGGTGQNADIEKFTELTK